MAKAIGIAYVSKPFYIDEFLILIASLLSFNQQDASAS
jgi:hypothetical protein